MTGSGSTTHAQAPSNTDAVAATLASHTTLRLGGPATSLAVAEDEQQLIAALSTNEPVLLLAGGSNVVISDDGFPGRVVLVRSRGVAVSRHGERVRLRVAAGEPWDQVVQAAVEAGWSGLERSWSSARSSF